ncbi:MAG: tRNA (adenosine(37)-N6)-dimethylallyltransferase MiaA [Gammaproteobacteria bacterium]|nr:tRNA (adenosine(37)-N6)-dimethylallyltransferase MiaA [Gammaproteobacteria bacterium]MCZ6827771.1 tRNA (adenosine(37)-N6)-dimethylallyltransferase MiaA [Gammaproteobacteria bacterium]MCZ6912601.1 tRNA (adenosine(37)-N6)-dimethylallyltransferase MiaA [Pseudomonadota bacterium]
MSRPAQRPLALMLMGPTATGKTAAVIELAQHVPLEIISVDSAMVYRGLDIGTAKPPLAERAGVTHHLIDIRDPVEIYSAGEFRRDALGLMDEIGGRGRLPVLVGGTMLYFNVLLHGLADLPEANAEIRRSLDDEAERVGWPAMHRRLVEIDPDAAAKIRENDAQRIQRALEVFEISGRTISSFHRKTATEPAADFLRIALWPEDRERLARKIGERFDQMMAQGLLAEVETLYERDELHADLPAMRSVGYRQLWQHLAGETDLEQAVEDAKVATRHLAKRQLTWLRADEDVNRVPALEESRLAPINRLLERWLENQR